MTEQLDFLYITIVTSKDAEAAYRFHQRMAANPDSHLWAKTEDEIKTLIEDGTLFGAWMGTDKKLVALCYVTLSDNERNWEIGGLAIDDAVKRRKIGSLLLRFAIAYTLVYDTPWNNGQKLIAHVHQGNQDPRGLIDKLGFRYLRTVEVSESDNPPKWMERNSEGKVVGDEFEFPPSSSKLLIKWFDEELDQFMQQVNVEFGFGYAYNLDDLKCDLREISEAH